ncbi:MAG: DUF4292 domain-containing protein [Flavobacteriaceae bacterium]|nr:DUF4292 domain-containing protein [Flavobacteriaceae bacterium]
MSTFKNHIAILVTLMLFSACGGGKAVVGGVRADRALNISSIIATHRAASPNFNTLASRVQVVYKDDKREHSITVSLRIKKDETIWIKASLLGITLAKVLITPDQVSYYETISNTFFDGDFTLLSEWLGTELDFEKTQSILLGQSIFGLDKSDYTSLVTENKYQLEPKRQPNNFIHSLLLNPENFKVFSGSLSQPNDGRLLSLRYGEYQEIDGGYYPKEIFIKSSEGGSNTEIDVKYKKIDLNVSVNFKFKIPEGYEEIQLSK